MSKLVTALAAGILALAATGAARAQELVDMQVGTMNWQGGAAQVPVDIGNISGALLRPYELICDFVALGRVAGVDRQRLPPLAPGDRVTLNVMADVGGQLIDSVRCRLVPPGQQ